MHTELETQGFCTLSSVLSKAQVGDACEHLDRLLLDGGAGILESKGVGYGIRNLWQHWPEVVELVRSPATLEFVRKELGSQVGMVRGLFFDKPPGRSWTLPWHRDRTIAVKDHTGELGTFSNPTSKSGIPHLIAPNQLLSRMLTLRFSLDPMQLQNGPLVVLPGSHLIDSDRDEDLDASIVNAVQTVFCQAGDVFVMRPLLAHSSLKSADDTQLRRRVVHIELAPEPHLEGDVEWHEFVPL